VRPRLRRHSTEATTGRGLQLLDSVASAWGVEPRSAGKTVWFEVDGAGAAEFGGEDLAALLAELGEEVPATRPGPGAVAQAPPSPRLGPADPALLVPALPLAFAA
jgi:hypothetical protein